MNNFFDKIKILKDELDQLTFSDDNRKRLEEKFRLEFNYNSNHLEGNTITYLDTKALLLKDIVTNTYTFRELDEMKAHDAAYSMIYEWAAEKNRDITEAEIKQLNKIILVKDFYKDAITPDGSPTRKLIKVGEYKTAPNSVLLSNGEKFHYADPIDVPSKMKELMDWYHNEKEVLHPIALATIFHHKFVLIHPFDDGNGRISRLLMNYILLRNGFPPLVIKSANKDKYLNALRLADVGNMEAFIDYICQQMAWSLQLSINAAHGESIEEPDDWEKELSLLSKKEETIPVRKSVDIVIKRMDDSFFPLFRALIRKVELNVMRLFAKVKTYVLIECEDITECAFNTYLNEPLLYRNITDFTRQKLVFHIECLEYKNIGADSFNLNLDIEILLDSYSYKINISNDESFKLEMPYNHILSEVEVYKIINFWGQNLVLQIREKNK